MSEFKVPTIDIALWLQSIINEYSPTTVMLKMDIEGSEYEVLPLSFTVVCIVFLLSPQAVL